MNKNVLIVDLAASILSLTVACVSLKNPKLSKGLTYASSAALLLCIALLSAPKKGKELEAAPQNSQTNHPV